MDAVRPAHPLADGNRAVHDHLLAAIGDAAHESWFGRFRVDSIEGTLAVCSVPTRFLKSWIADRYDTTLRAAIGTTWPGVTRYAIGIRRAEPCVVPVAPAAIVSTPLPVPPAPSVEPQRTTFAALPSGLEPDPLDPSMTLASFQEGSSNETAVAAARALIGASRDAAPARWLVFSGPPGSGKSHLLQAIVTNLRDGAKGAERRALYLSAGTLSRWLRTQPHDIVATRLRGVDCVAIDDLVLIEGGMVRVRFGALLRDLRAPGGPHLVIALSGPVRDLDEKFGDAVLSRLSEALAVTIAPPDPLLRRQLVESLARDASLTLSPDIQGAIADAVFSGARGLRGAVARLALQHSMGALPTAVPAILALIADLMPEETKRPPVRIEWIVAIVAEYYGVSTLDILSARRTAIIVRPRQIAMYLAKMLTLRSLPEIGRRMGGRDHTTVLHGSRKVAQLAPYDSTLRGELDTLKSRIEHRARAVSLGHVAGVRPVSARGAFAA